MIDGSGEKPWRRRGQRLLLPGIAALALLLRLRFLLGNGGPLASPTDYDDGVYFSAAALLARGVLPYRDFVFVHPPGIAWFYALVGWWDDPAAAFTAGRIAAAVIGALNTFLAGALVLRSGSLPGAVIAAASYAAYPEAANAERSTYLEPLLNLGCLASAWMWLSGWKGTSRRPWVAGMFAGGACAVKLLGGIWVVAAVISPPAERRLTSRGRMLAGGLLTGGALLAPLVLLAPRAFFEQVLWFQLVRPSDGTSAMGERLALMLGRDHLALTFLSCVAIALAGARALTRGIGHVTREERFFITATLLTVVAFVTSASYWAHYNSYLAASQCVLAGLGAAAATRLLRSGPARSAAAAVAVAVVVVTPVRAVVAASEARSAEQVALRTAVAQVASDVSIFSFDPSWGLVAGKLPPHGDGAPVVVDSYGSMLLQAMKDGGPYASADEAFREASAQPDVVRRLEASEFAIIGWRGMWQLPPHLRTTVAATFLCVTPQAGDLCVHRHLEQSIQRLGLTAADLDIAYRDGWYDEEGTAPASWRWMSGSSEAVLPPLQGGVRLQVDLYVPPEILASAPVVTFSLDGRPLESVRADGAALRRGWDLVATGVPQRLTITTSATFVPAATGGSPDRRRLGLSLRRLVWLPADEWSRFTGLAANGGDAAASRSSPK